MQIVFLMRLKSGNNTCPFIEFFANGCTKFQVNK